MKDSLDIAAIFKNHMKIEPKVMAIETLFNNERRFNRTNYNPPYQRNYVWNVEKGSYFIESILLGTEIPPLIFFNSGDFIEVIDGKQRYETIYRFVNNHFKLKNKGLLKLKDLGNKNFNALKDLKDIIWDTKLRIIEFSFHSKPAESEIDIEDVVKKEIFRRYNTGITPLKPTEIDNAKYVADDLNSYIKKVLRKDTRLHETIKAIFYSENDKIEKTLKKIRQLLVLHNIPISFYADKKEEVVSKFYDLLSEQTENDTDVKSVFDSFIKKLNFLLSIKRLFDKSKVSANRLVFECLYWALSVLENENVDFKIVDNIKFKNSLFEYLKKEIAEGIYVMDRSSFAQNIFMRYNDLAIFFEKNLEISFRNYVRNNDNFKKLNRNISHSKTDSDALEKFESLRLNKPDASSISIDDICTQMQKQRFLIRPIYQRQEVINKNKSSSIIESILLGIKLPPIFVFKRDDGISEVVDGQQRLLSILGFLGKDYLDENKNFSKSDKSNFSLNLKNSILKELDRKKYTSLPDSLKNRILDYDLWMIEINQKNNEHFDPIDLFIRLNYKPYPIKENTFEMWNSYIDRRIIESVKIIYSVNKDWFYLRKVSNSRMENEGLIISLIYLEYKCSLVKLSVDSISTFLDTYKVGDRINIRIKSKNDISKILESPDSTQPFLDVCNAFENSFLRKVKYLVYEDKESGDKFKEEHFDFLLNTERSIRTNQDFYALWLFLSNISYDKIVENKSSLVQDIKHLFVLMSNVESKEAFESAIKKLWKKHNK